MDEIKKFFQIGEYDPFRPKTPKAVDAAGLDQVRQLLRQQGQFDAIQLYQHLADCDLHTAMGAVKQMELEEKLAHPFADADWLPAHCPDCGAALTNDLVHWVNAGTANCPYCGARLHEPEEPEDTPEAAPPTATKPQSGKVQGKLL